MVKNASKTQFERKRGMYRSRRCLQVLISVVQPPVDIRAIMAFLRNESDRSAIYWPIVAFFCIICNLFGGHFKYGMTAPSCFSLTSHFRHKDRIVIKMNVISY